MQLSVKAMALTVGVLWGGMILFIGLVSLFLHRLRRRVSEDRQFALSRVPSLRIVGRRTRGNHVWLDRRGDWGAFSSLGSIISSPRGLVRVDGPRNELLPEPALGLAQLAGESSLILFSSSRTALSNSGRRL